MTKIVFVRHGEVNGNVQGRFMGFTDQGLNENGSEQIEALSLRLKEDFDIAYVSTLSRTKQTFEILAKEIKIPEIRFLDSIKERNFGIFENMNVKELSEKYPKEYSLLCEDWENYKIPHGESAKEAYQRVCEAFDDIVAQHRGKKILLVTHLGCIRYILAHKITGEMRKFWNFTVNNGSYSTIEEADDFFILSKLNA